MGIGKKVGTLEEKVVGESGRAKMRKEGVSEKKYL